LTVVATHPAARFETQSRAARLRDEIPAAPAPYESAWTLEQVVQDAQR